MKLNVLVMKSGEYWIAMGLEHCVMGQKETLAGALRAFLDDLALQIVLDNGAEIEPLSETPPAPEHLWEKYRESPIHLTFDIPIPDPAKDWVEDIRVAA
jgi:hypothetical protein